MVGGDCQRNAGNWMLNTIPDIVTAGGMTLPATDGACVLNKKDAKRVLKEIESEKLYSVALVTDSDCIYELENYSAKLLNSEERYEQFLNRKEIGM